MLKLYADWGLDYIKVDCISDHPYRPTEIRQIAEAIRKTGRPIVLSLSPGPTQLDHAAEIAKYAQMWRITDDHWDAWTFTHNPPTAEYPFGLRDEFDRIAKWAPYVKPGNWPDPDMLPEGYLGPHPGKDQPRQSNYTHDEQRTEFTLWAISRSPLILGTNLTRLDDFTRSLITNKEVIDLNQQAVESGPGLLPKESWRLGILPAALLVRPHRRSASRTATSPSSISLTRRPRPTFPGRSSTSKTSRTPFTTSGTRSTSPAPRHCT